MIGSLVARVVLVALLGFMTLPTIVVILAVWVLLSLPMSVVLGLSMKSESRPELVGMEGDVAVFRRSNGALQRVSLVERTPA